MKYETATLVRSIAVMLALGVPAASFAAGVCVLDGNGAITPPTAVQVGNGGTDCALDPSSYSLTVYRVALCTSAPTAPTTGTAADLANCTTILDNSAGTEVSVIKGTATALPGTVTRPANASYTHIYAIMGLTTKISGSTKFNAPVTALAFSGAATNGTGSYCWTTNATVRYSEMASLTTPVVQCGDAVPGTIGIITQTNDSWGSKTGPFEATLADIIEGISGTQYLVDSGLKSATDFASTARMLVVQPQSTTVSSSTTGIDLGFKTSVGMNIGYGVDAGAVGVNTVEPGVFFMRVQLQ